MLSQRLGGINQFSQPYLMTYKPDGVVAGITRNAETGGTATDTGRWTLEGNNLCQQMDHWRNGARACSYFTTNGSQFRRASSDGVLFTYSPDVALDQVMWNGTLWAER